MLKKVIFIGIWLLFIGYATFFAPPQQPDTFDLITDLSTGNWEGINPYVICLFNIMGILPLVYASFLLIDGEAQPKIKAAPFVGISFGVGAFALLPYFAFRQDKPEFIGRKNWLLKILDSRLYAIVTTLACLSLIFIAVTQGNWSDFVAQWHTSKFIHVMSLDFLCLCSLFPSIVGDDLKKRGIYNSSKFWLITLVPLFGTLIYTCLRPSIDGADDNNVNLVDKTSQEKVLSN